MMSVRHVIHRSAAAFLLCAAFASPAAAQEESPRTPADAGDEAEPGSGDADTGVPEEPSAPIEPTDPEEPSATTEPEEPSEPPAIAEALPPDPPVSATIVVGEEAAAQGGDEGEDPEETPHPLGELELMDMHLAGSVRFSPGRGLSIASDDGLFALNTRVRLQVLYSAEDAPGQDLAHSLTLRRARLVFTGNFFGADNRFKLELALSPRDEGIRDVFESDGPQRTPLLDYYLEFRQLRELNVRVGQYKVPFSRQRVISSGNLQLVDRSIVNGDFTVDRDVGLDIRSRDLFGLGFLRYYLGVYIGQGRDAVGADDFGLMYVGRLEVLPFGMFDDYQEVDFARSYTPRLSIGVGFAAIDRARGDRGILGTVPDDGGTTNTQHFAADVVFMYGGFSFFSEFLLRMGQRNPGDAVDPMGVLIPAQPASEGWGLMAQAGYLLPNLPVEISARYGTTQPLGVFSTQRTRSELGLGLSYYVAQHPFKVQLDAFRIWADQFDVGATRIRLQVQASL